MAAEPTLAQKNDEPHLHLAACSVKTRTKRPPEKPSDFVPIKWRGGRDSNPRPAV